MMVDVIPKVRTIINDTDNDAEPVEENFTDLYANDETLANAHNALQTQVDNLPTAGTSNRFRTVSSDPVSPTAGDVWYRTDLNVPFYHDGTRVQQFGLKPKGFIYGAAPYCDGDLHLPSGLSAMNSVGTDIITLSADLTINIATLGPGGLDTGSITNNTWYYVYLIKNESSGASSGIISATNEKVTGNITLPSGYTAKRQLPIALRKPTTTGFLPWRVTGGWPYQPVYHYLSPNSGLGAFSAGFSGVTPGYYNVVSAGTSGSGVDLSAFVPPVALNVQFNVVKSNAAGIIQFSETPTVDGSGTLTSTTPFSNGGTTWLSFITPFLKIVLNSGIGLLYYSSQGSATYTIDVYSYAITEIN
jgi:hypothetical protein